MDYTFKTIKFSSGRKLIRIYFEKQKYYGLERFFNDDARILIGDIDEFLDYDTRDEIDDDVSFAGNRCIITFKKDSVLIEDQWEPDVDGAFSDIEISNKDFEDIYSDWKNEII